MTIRKLLFAAAVLGLTFSVACDIGKTTSQLSARKVVVATLLHTPAVELKPEAIAGFDASFPANDSGFSFDAGAFLSDAGITVPPQTAAFAFFGTRNGEGLDQTAPTAVAGATMAVQVKGGAELALKDQGSGSFSLSSVDDKALTYEENASYLYKANAGGDSFVAIVEKVPALERIAELHPAGKSYIDQAANTEFKFQRPDPPTGQDRNLAFVFVIPISRDGKQGEPTYTNLPSKPLDYLKLVIAPSDWTRTTVTVPGSAFPEPNKNYIILLQSAKLGHPDSDNLFTGSAIIAGTADVGIVKTR
jgi:hypothetical protein